MIDEKKDERWWVPFKEPINIFYSIIIIFIATMFFLVISRHETIITDIKNRILLKAGQDQVNLMDSALRNTQEQCNMLRERVSKLEEGKRKDTLVIKNIK